jgi:hypothetical protein
MPRANLIPASAPPFINLAIGILTAPANISIAVRPQTVWQEVRAPCDGIAVFTYALQVFELTRVVLFFIDEALLRDLVFISEGR